MIPPSPPPPCKPGEFHHVGDAASRAMWKRGDAVELKAYYEKRGGYLCPLCKVWVWTWDDFCAAHSGAPSFTTISKRDLYDYGEFVFYKVFETVCLLLLSLLTVEQARVQEYERKKRWWIERFSEAAQRKRRAHNVDMDASDNEEELDSDAAAATGVKMESVHGEL